MDFSGKVALVTGAGRGLGRAIAEKFASLGALVAVNDITPINLDRTIQRIQAAGGIGRDYIGDVAKQMPVQTLIDQVLTDFGRIDILINNAAVRPHAHLLELDAWDWQRTLDVNLSGAFYLMQLVGRAMRQQGGGAIINIAAFVETAQELVGYSAFYASKMGLIGLTKTAAEELAPYQIRVHAICPGEGIRGVLSNETDTSTTLGVTWVVVEKILELADPKAVWLTGEVFEMS